MLATLGQEYFELRFMQLMLLIASPVVVLPIYDKTPVSNLLVFQL